MSEGSTVRPFRMALHALGSKLRFAVLAMGILPILGGTLVTLGVPRAPAIAVTFACLAIMGVPFLLARLALRNRQGALDIRVAIVDFERREIKRMMGRARARSAGPVQAVKLPTWEERVLLLTARVAALFSSSGVH